MSSIYMRDVRSSVNLANPVDYGGYNSPLIKLNLWSRSIPPTKEDRTRWSKILVNGGLWKLAAMQCNYNLGRHHGFHQLCSSTIFRRHNIFHNFLFSFIIISIGIKPMVKLLSEMNMQFYKNNNKKENKINMWKEIPLQSQYY